MTFRRSPRVRGTLTWLLGAALVAGCTPSRAQPQAEGAGQGPVIGGEAPPPASPVPPPVIPPGASPSVDAGRQSAGVVAAGGIGAPYNYGPAVMQDGDRVRMWWCSQYPAARPPGDDILHAESAGIAGPFTGPGGGPAQAVLSGNPGAFDGVHTCDPSVLKVDGVYYLYYTGAAGDHALGNSIGMATSPDGINWTRANGGNPILNPARDTARENTYGAGQPAVVFLDGWFYLMFTDTTGRAAGWNGAGQFIVRSKDPGFATGVEALGERGFEPVPNTQAPRTRSLVDAFSADLMWIEALESFGVAHETEDGTTVTFLDRNFSLRPYPPVLVPGPWKEGPGLLRQPDGHAPISVDDPCGRVPLDVVRATMIGEAGAPTHLKHFGIDLHGIDGCGDVNRMLTVLDGFAMPSPVRTMDLVAGGSVVRVDRRTVADRLAVRLLDQRIPGMERVPVAAHLATGVPAVQAPTGGVGLLLNDGKLWAVRPPGVAELNGSAVTPITDEQWNGYPAGLALG
ncbi:beta-xylosidase [Amycolatopsis albispora]|uniref:beta-xylosidase n=1 Tax=Amycolatopsis albispora TaxID=1804986 RepID=UPI001F3542CD|nr:beta-xylosidase [Amycolatopsis albispora]